jgi:hypothetical protein
MNKPYGPRDKVPVRGVYGRHAGKRGISNFPFLNSLGRLENTDVLVHCAVSILLCIGFLSSGISAAADKHAPVVRAPEIIDNVGESL